jgi:uncharacterized XkdX family phage protein
MDNNFWFGVIKKYYNLGLYNASDLELFVEGKMITAGEKVEIVGTNTTQFSAS